jgi:hypothetical protein
VFGEDAEGVQPLGRDVQVAVRGVRGRPDEEDVLPPDEAHQALVKPLVDLAHDVLVSDRDRVPGPGGGRPMLHPGVGDDQLAAVEDVVAHQLVEEVGEFRAERASDLAGEAVDLGQRVGEPVGAAGADQDDEAELGDLDLHRFIREGAI